MRNTPNRDTEGRILGDGVNKNSSDDRFSKLKPETKKIK